MDMNVGTWRMVAARDMPRLPSDAATVFMAQADTPLQLQVQIVDGGASRFINANRHEFHTYVELLPANRYKLSGVPANRTWSWHNNGNIHRTGRAPSQNYPK
jgi:hypothetical protein